MKIALLSFEYPPETGFGGIGTYTWFHARALARLGHEVHVIAGAPAPTPLRPAHHDGVQVWRSRAGGAAESMLAPLGRWRWWWSRERARNGVDMYRALRQVQQSHAFDVIEMPECGAEGLLVNHLGRTPTVVRFHSPARLIMRHYDVQPGDITCCSALESFAMRGATAFTSTSRFLADAVRTELGVTRPLPVVYNGIDVDWFDDSEQVDARRELGVPVDRPMILFVGRMERRKGIHWCPDIVANILERHDVSFVFAGDDLFGHVANELMPRLAGRTLRGQLYALGRLGNTQVRSLMRQADIVFLPSIWESCPYSCLEAMAASRAIVASDAGGFPELLRHGESGMIVPSGDIVGFVDALRALLDDAPRRAALGRAARAAVETSFRDTRIAQESVEHYARLVH